MNPVHFAQMIYPYKGYLCNFADKHFSFNELCQVYENQIAAGFERTTGRELFANELSALSFWLVLTPEDKQGHFQWSEFKKLLHAFRFTRIETPADFDQEFKTLLNKNRFEVYNSEDNTFRFDLCRQIFLERGL